MVTRHQHGTRTSAGVSTRFGNFIVRTSFNEAATEYNKLQAAIKQAHSNIEFRRLLKDWIKKNIVL